MGLKAKAIEKETVMQDEVAEIDPMTLHCECPLNGEPCCTCGVFECPALATEARRHEMEHRQAGHWNY